MELLIPQTLPVLGLLLCYVDGVKVIIEDILVYGMSTSFRKKNINNSC